MERLPRSGHDIVGGLPDIAFHYMDGRQCAVNDMDSALRGK
jgi:hypothetical protein